MYHDFLIEQIEKGHMTEIPHREFDVYDLAALAFLYKRIKETEVISEAHHVVIDEAQDMDADEFALVSALMKRNENMRVIAVGDDDQNIYGFRGSNSGHMLSLVADYGVMPVVAALHSHLLAVTTSVGVAAFNAGAVILSVVFSVLLCH